MCGIGTEKGSFEVGSYKA